ncbi:hypothetical protein [Pseudoalteromonas piscicida]|uniref:Uncharacterized protein n=1 Tax=Pseudoalteromonas piscicida TaxID=43662 RepID=A0AAD0RLX0_PSEO7|nr:hypothetical protein [Pseudoalteromonas piscicida]ASD68688.1 hypothetical protein B1L02_17810 [Pseudoalteromonas piscicida]AXQ99430.1 hypothetical protein D0N37_18040 [Pseudoalteromonas piscicida]AXR03746.1 hypothetical protein D0511_17890 [Pseudoalteromonas piscicida]
MLVTYLLASAFIFMAYTYSKSCKQHAQTKAKLAVLLSASLIAAAKWQAGLSSTVVFFVFAVSLGVLSLFITLAQPQKH